MPNAEHPHPHTPILLVPAGRERRFLAPLPVETLWELRPEALRKLHLLGLRTLGQIAGLAPRVLAGPLGPAGAWYRRLAAGLDRRPVAVWSPAPFEMEARFVEEEAGREQLDAQLEEMAAKLAARLVRVGRYARVLSVTVHLGGGRRISATRHLKAPTHLTPDLSRAARALLTHLLERQKLEGGSQGSGVRGQGSPETRDQRPETRDPNTERRTPNAEPLNTRTPEHPSAHYLPLTTHHSPTFEALELTVTGLEAQGALQLSIFRDEDRSPALRAVLARLQERYGERALVSARRLLRDRRDRF